MAHRALISCRPPVGDGQSPQGFGRRYSTVSRSPAAVTVVAAGSVPRLNPATAILWWTDPSTKESAVNNAPQPTVSGAPKQYDEMQNVGTCRYVVNYHDGEKLHRDGSLFFDIAIFSNKRKKDRFVRGLAADGYRHRSAA